MRYREQSNLLVQTTSWVETYYCENGNNGTIAGTSEWVNGSWQSMTDAGSAKTDRIRTRFLEHQRSTIQSFPIDIKYPLVVPRYACSSGLTNYFGISGRLGPGYYIRGNPWILNASEINTCLLEAIRFFESGCAAKETLLANFGWELPDVRSLWPTFKDFLNQFRKGKLKKLDAVQDAKRSVKTFSSSYLAYQFGVAPLIGDLIKIWDRLKSLDDHISWLKKNSGQTVRVVYRSSLRQQTLDASLPYRPTLLAVGNGSAYCREIPEQRSGFKAWAYITYDVSQLTELQLKTRTLLRSFGLNNPAAILWEAIPYSFVVDWISNVGDLVSLLEVPIKLPCVFQDCGYGVWSESTIEDWYVTNGHKACIRRTKTRGYGRRPGLPVNISSLSLDTPTAKQLVLGLALMGQKL